MRITIEISKSKLSTIQRTLATSTNALPTTIHTQIIITALNDYVQIVNTTNAGKGLASGEYTGPIAEGDD